jgi:hypothetical protein
MSKVYSCLTVLIVTSMIIICSQQPTNTLTYKTQDGFYIEVTLNHNGDPVITKYKKISNLEKLLGS